MRLKSIRGRLLLWLAFLFACLLTGFGVTAYQLQRGNRLKQIDDELVRRVAALSDDAREHGPGGQPPDFGPPDDDFGPGPPPGPPPQGIHGPQGPRNRTIRLSAATKALFNVADTNGFYYQYWSRDEDVLKRSANAPVAVSMPEPSAPAAVFDLRTRGAFREAFHFTEMGECALVGRNIAADFAAMRRFAFGLMAAGGAVLGLGLAGSGWLVTRALRPVEKISATASRISAGKLSERINLAHIDSELGVLADTLNDTFARLEATFAQQKQFTGDAAHELRTPVSVMLTHAQNGLASSCAADGHHEAFEACQRAAQRMRHLIESLLELMELDTGQEAIKRQPMDLALVAAECVALVKPLATLHHITIHAELAPCAYDGDSHRLAQVISNLLANAIHYNKTNGEVRISTQAKEGAAVLTVRDTGRGILEEDLPHIFERFYRADKSRSTERFYRVDKLRTTAGRGLGLAISKAIIQAHGGAIEVQSVPEEGSEFQIILPRSS